MQLKIGISLVLALLVAGCATQTKSDKRMQVLEMKLKKQRVKLQDLKERNMVLERRAKSPKVAQEISEQVGEAIVQSEPPAELPGSFEAVAAGTTPKVTVATNAPSKLPAKLAVAPTPISVASEMTGEHFLYSKILETYRSKNKEELDRTQQLLMKSYPESVFADNSLYLAGLLAFEKQDYKTALRQFDKLLSEYPRSNKAVAALFARASVEKRMGRSQDAKRSYMHVRDLYPGSPEAARVSVELKLLEPASVKHRES